MKKNTLDDFIKNIYPEPNTGCWLWGGRILPDGYGSFRLNGVNKAHRVSLSIYNPNFNKLLDVLHKCDNPCCVNPDHLFQGTQSDNNKDRARKGRTNKGEKHPRAKFTNNQIIEIRSKAYLGPRELARIYNVTHSCIQLILRKITWAHI